MAEYDSTEQDLVLDVFVEMLRAATSDGGRKRAAGLKPPWWADPGHEDAFWRHEMRRQAGELVDPDSGAHPGVHEAWRLLAIAAQETFPGLTPDEMLRKLGGDG